MRSTLLAVLALSAASTGSAAPDLLADLRAEVAAIAASATLTSGIQSRSDGGPRYQTNSVKLLGGEATYELCYKSFLPPNEGRNRAELNDGSSGLGMQLPSVHGWYRNGFVDAALVTAQSSCSIADRCAGVRLVRDSGKVVATDFTWQLGNGRMRLRFLLLAHRPELFLAIKAVPATPDARLSLEFRCYPGGFTSPFDRRVHTALREFPHAGPEVAEVEVDPIAEPWMVLADHYPGLTMRPMGPCTIAAAPQGLETAGARIRGNYSVCPFYTTHRGVTSALVALREFGPTPWQAARDEIAATADQGLLAAREALAELPE